MWFRHQLRFLTVAVALVAASSVSLSAQDSAHRGRKYKPPPPTSKIEVTVVRDSDSKPIENASVIFDLIGEKGNMELKTNEDGKSTIDVIPIGSKIRLQIIAKGYKTYGEDYSIEKPAVALAVRLKRPTEQYSIYKDHPDQDSGSKDNENQKDAPKDKPNGSSEQPPKP